MDGRATSFNAAMTAAPGDLQLRVEPSRIAGVVPAALRGGQLLSNGPGWTRIGDRLVHPFDGHGYVRAFTLEADGGVRLRARYVETETYRAEVAAQRVVRRGLGTNIGASPWQNLRPGPKRNVANTTIVPWAGRLLAGWEGGEPHALDPETLTTAGPETFGGALAGQATLAHFKVDARAQRLVTLSLRMGPSTQVTFREFDATGALAAERAAQLPGVLFAHDFVVTPRWYVLASNPLRFKWGALARAVLGAGTLLEALATRGEPGALHLVPRQGGGPVRTVPLPGPCFVVHYGNAFERGEAVVVDACLFEDFSFGAEFGYRGPDRPLDPALPDARPPQRLYRITVPASGEASWVQLAAHAVDFPRVHPEHDGQDTPALFGATRADPRFSDPFDSLIKVHLDDPGRPPVTWTAPPNVFVGEPLPAPVSGGYVLCLLSHGLEARTTLAIFAADRLAEGPVASVPLPLLPYGFHGTWVAPAAAH